MYLQWSVTYEQFLLAPSVEKARSIIQSAVRVNGAWVTYGHRLKLVTTIFCLYGEDADIFPLMTSFIRGAGTNIMSIWNATHQRFSIAQQLQFLLAAQKHLGLHRLLGPTSQASEQSVTLAFTQPRNLSTICDIMIAILDQRIGASDNTRKFVGAELGTFRRWINGHGWRFTAIREAVFQRTELWPDTRVINSLDTLIHYFGAGPVCGFFVERQGVLATLIELGHVSQLRAGVLAIWGYITPSAYQHLDGFWNKVSAADIKHLKYDDCANWSWPHWFGLWPLLRLVPWIATPEPLRDWRYLAIFARQLGSENLSEAIINQKIAGLLGGTQHALGASGTSQKLQNLHCNDVSDGAQHHGGDQASSGDNFGIFAITQNRVR